MSAPARIPCPRCRSEGETHVLAIGERLEVPRECGECESDGKVCGACGAPEMRCTCPAPPSAVEFDLACFIAATEVHGASTPVEDTIVLGAQILADNPAARAGFVERARVLLDVLGLEQEAA